MKKLVYITILVAHALFCIPVYTLWTAGTDRRFEMSESEVEGKRVWQSKNCVACHQIYGLGGYMGPDLTPVLSNPEREGYVRIVLANGMGRMPKFDLSEGEINSLVAFLKYLSQTQGPKEAQLLPNWWGSLSSSEGESRQ